MNKYAKGLLAVTGLCLVTGIAMAGDPSSTPAGVAKVATNVTTNLRAVANLITAASYVAGMAFAVGAIVKFKAHKDNPTQIPIGTPIALLFVGAALIFIPSVFKTSGATLFEGSGTVAGVSGVASFGATKAK